MKISTLFPPDLPTSVNESDNAIESYIAWLIMHAAKIENQKYPEQNEFRWSISEEMEFRGTISTSATVVID